MNNDKDKESSSSFRRVFKQIKQCISLIFIGTIVGCIIMTLFNLKGKEKSKEVVPTTVDVEETIETTNPHEIITVQTVRSILQPAASLITSYYYYTDASTAKYSKDLFGLELPFTTNEIVFTYDGVIGLGVEMSEINYEIDEETKTITVELPDIGVLTNNIDFSSFEVPYEKKSIFNDSDFEKYSEMINELKIHEKEKVLSNTELLKNVEENTKSVLRNFLTAAKATSSYEVRFK